MSGTEQSWVTLATNDSYALGALVVARSLKRVHTTRKLTVMITPGVTGPMREALGSEFDVVSQVNVLDSKDEANLALLTRPELGITFTKLHCWKLTQFSKCVFLDADTLILQNCDELFDREEFSAAPDVGWPDCFNSGVFVFKPSVETFTKLLNFAVTGGSFDGGDQGLLNLYFNDWSVADISRHLPFVYNMVASATYSYLPAFRVFGANVKIVHFIGSEKPWLMFFDTGTGTVRAPFGQEHLQELLQAWWDIFRADVHRKLSPEMGGADNSQSATVLEQAGLAAVFAKMSLEGEKSSQLIEAEEQMRKHAWESGHIDYLGKDSFDNILKKLQASMAQSAATPTDASPEPRPKSKSPSPPKVTPPAPEPVPEPQPAVVEAPEPAPQPIPEQPVPVVEPVAAPAPTAQPPPQPVVESVTQPAPQQQTEDTKEAEERAALEKKLAEQKRIAEQKLQEEKLASEARVAAEAAAAAAATAAVASTASPVVPPETPPVAPEDAPVAPPRRQSKVTAGGGGEGARGVVWRNVGYRVGLGLSCIAVAAYAIYNASASASSSFPNGESSESSSEFTDRLNNNP